MLKKLRIKWVAPVLIICALMATSVLGALAGPGSPDVDSAPAPAAAPAADPAAPQTSPTPIPSAQQEAETEPLGEAPSDLPSGMVRAGDVAETHSGVVRGRTTTFSDAQNDPGPSGVVAWFRVQEAGSGLKPVWEGKGAWLGAPEKKGAKINGAPVTLDYNVDAGTFDGEPFRQTWLKGSWTKDGMEYQMLGINVSVADFARMANSVR